MANKKREKYKRWSFEDMVLVERMRSNGWKWIDIAKHFKTSKSNMITVYRYRKNQQTMVNARKRKAVEKLEKYSSSVTLGLQDRHIKAIVELLIVE